MRFPVLLDIGYPGPAALPGGPGHREGSPLFPGWLVVGGAFTVLLMAYGLQFSYGVFLPAMAAELGWDRAALSGPYSLYVVVYSVLSFQAGRLTDRFGPRGVITAGALCLGAGYGLLALADAPWQLHASLGVLAGIGNSVAFVPCNATVIRWFVRRRGLALGIAACGSTVAGAVMPLVSALLIEGFGWREAIAILALASAGLMMLAAGAMRRDPEGAGLRPDGDPAPGAAPGPAAPPAGGSAPPEAAFTLREARSTGTLWLLAAALFLSWIVVFLPFVHLPAHAADLGLGSGAGALLASAIGLGGLGGRIACGLATDRLGRIPGLVMAYALQVLAFAGFALLTSTTGLYLAALAFGISYASVGVLFPALVGDYFGRAHVGSITGLVFSMAGTAAALGPWLGGLIRDLTGHYEAGFLLGVLVNGIGLVLLAFLRRPAPRRS